MLYPKTFGENPLFPQACNFAVVPKDNNSGFGVITFQAYKPGDLLAIVTGEMVSDIRQHTLQVSKRRHMYDPYFTGYLLHSCEPNVSLNMKKMTLTALKEIKRESFCLWIMQKLKTSCTDSLAVVVPANPAVAGLPGARKCRNK